MNNISIDPGEGIGPLKLGMSHEQILSAIDELCGEYSILDNSKLDIVEEEYENCFAIRYISDNFFFMVQYEQGRAADIAVDRRLSESIDVNLLGKEVFNAKANELVAFMETVCTCHSEQ